MTPRTRDGCTPPAVALRKAARACSPALLAVLCSLLLLALPLSPAPLWSSASPALGEGLPAPGAEPANATFGHPSPPLGTLEARRPEERRWESIGVENPAMESPVQLARFVARGGHEELSPEERRQFFVDFARRAPEHLARVWDEVADEVPARARHLAAPAFERQAQRRMESLSPRDQVALLLGRGSREAASRRLRKERSKAVRAMLKDPALRRNFERIRDSWLRGLLTGGSEARRKDPHDSGAGAPDLPSPDLPSPDLPSPDLLYTRPEELVEIKVLVARNLFFAGREVSRASVLEEIAALTRLRQRYRQVALFSERQVVYVASRQQVPGTGDAVFAADKVRRSLDRDAGELSLHGGALRPTTRASGLSPVGEVLAEVERSEQLTFLFSGHGRSRALKYRGGIGARQLARALARRPRSKVRPEPAIVLVLACEGHDFARHLLEELEGIDPSVAKPIVVTAEEFGQPWEKPVYGDRLSRTLGHGSASLGRLAREWGTGTSIFVPGPDNQPRQIY